MTKDETLAYTLDVLLSLREMIVFRMPKPGEYEKQVLARLSLASAMIRDQLENHNEQEQLRDRRLFTAESKTGKTARRTATSSG